jgi:hypothetical protein
MYRTPLAATGIVLIFALRLMVLRIFFFCRQQIPKYLKNLASKVFKRFTYGFLEEKLSRSKQVLGSLTSGLTSRSFRYAGAGPTGRRI